MNVRRAGLWIALVASLAGLGGCDKMKSAMGTGDVPADPASIAAQKFAKYGLVQNDLAQLHPFDQELAEYAEYNPELATKGGLDTYQVVTNSFGSAIHLLQDAMTVKADLGPLDTAGTRLLAALQALNPTVKAMRTYADTRGWNADGGTKALELDPVYRSQMQEAAAADREFAQLLATRGMELDTAHLKTLPPDSVEYHVLETSMATRRTVAALSDLTEHQSPAAKASFVASLVPAAAANRGLGAAVDAYKGKIPMTHCKLYQSLTQQWLSAGPATASDPTGTAHGGTRAEKFLDTYNEHVADLGRCEDDLHEK